MTGTHGAGFVALPADAFFSFLSAHPLVGQASAGTLLGWSGEAEVGASLFSGDSEQTMVTTRTDVTRTGSATEL